MIAPPSKVTIWGRPWTPSGRTGAEVPCRPRSSGLTLLEIAITIALLSLIMIGVLATLSTSFLAQRNNTDHLECQLLGQRVLEEVKSRPYDSLLSFNGTRVDDPSGKYRASVSATMAATNLVQIEVVTAALETPANVSRVVTLISRPE